MATWRGQRPPLPYGRPRMAPWGAAQEGGLARLDLCFTGMVRVAEDYGATVERIRVMG